MKRCRATIAKKPNEALQLTAPSAAALRPATELRRYTSGGNMKAEDGDHDIQTLARRVFGVVGLLTGDEPEFHQGSGWYKVGEPILAWFYVVGTRAKKNPPNSILVTATKPDGELSALASKLGNNMYGSETPEYVVTCNDSLNFAGFLQFIGRAYTARHAA